MLGWAVGAVLAVGLALRYQDRHPVTSLSFQQPASAELLFIKTPSGWWIVDTGSEDTMATWRPAKLCISDKCVMPGLASIYILLQVLYAEQSTNLPVNGVIGQDLLKQFREVDIDYNTHTMRFEE